MSTVTVADLELTGSYEATGNVLCRSTPVDDKLVPVQQTREGHAVRLGPDGRITNLTAINARWLLDRDGELIATLRDRRRLRIGPDDAAELLRLLAAGPR